MELKIKWSEGTSVANQVTKIDTIITVPDLQGSAKQVEWANKIRHDWFNRVLFGRLSGATTEQIQQVLDVNPHVLSRKAQTSAKWWIDNKDNPKAM